MDETRTRYSIVQEPHGDIYRGLLRFLGRFCDSALIVVREPASSTAAVNAVLNQLDAFLVDARDDSHWPGTNLIGHTARVYRYKFNDQSCDLFCRSVDRLYDWMSPHRPEDLCILNEQTPWLTTVAHERESYLNLPAQKHEELKQTLRGIVLFPGDFMPRSKELYRLFGAYLDEYSLSRGTSCAAALDTFISETSAPIVDEAIASIRQAVFFLKEDAILRVVLDRLGASKALLLTDTPSSTLIKLADQLELQNLKRAKTPLL